MLLNRIVAGHPSYLTSFVSLDARHTACTAAGNTPAVITESQNHRMLGVGRDLCGSSSPTLPPKQGHLQQAAEDLVQVGLEYLQRRRYSIANRTRREMLFLLV